MPINQFNFKPKGFGINQETTGTVKTGSGNYYNDYYYRSPEYDRLTGGIGAGNSSYGLRNTTNANRLDPSKELYERTLGELVSTLVGNSDTTKVNRYYAPSSGSYHTRSPQYITIDNVDYGNLYRLGDTNDEIAKTQAVLAANGYNVGVSGVYDTATKNALYQYKQNNGIDTTGALTYGNKTINSLNNAGNRVTVDDFNKMYQSSGNNTPATPSKNMNVTTGKTTTKKNKTSGKKK